MKFGDGYLSREPRVVGELISFTRERKCRVNLRSLH